MKIQIVSGIVMNQSNTTKQRSAFLKNGHAASCGADHLLVQFSSGVLAEIAEGGNSVTAYPRAYLYLTPARSLFPLDREPNSPMCSAIIAEGGNRLIAGRSGSSHQKCRHLAALKPCSGVPHGDRRGGKPVPVGDSGQLEWWFLRRRS